MVLVSVFMLPNRADAAKKYYYKPDFDGPMALNDEGTVYATWLQDEYVLRIQGEGEISYDKWVEMARLFDGNLNDSRMYSRYNFSPNEVDIQKKGFGDWKYTVVKNGTCYGWANMYAMERPARRHHNEGSASWYVAIDIDFDTNGKVRFEKRNEFYHTGAPYGGWFWYFPGKFKTMDVDTSNLDSLEGFF